MNVEEILKKYPNRVPVIVSKKQNSDIADIEKKKYLIPKDTTIGNFVYVIRKGIKLPPHKAMFLFINNKLQPNTKTFGELYETEKDSDGFLYVIYSGESVFG